jgi:hypothetical protein
MRLILVGCEYAGKTTLANAIVAWTGRTMGGGRTFHDHFTMPCSEYSEEDQEQLMRLSPRLKEQFQRYMIDYHLNPAFYSDPDHNLVGYHIEEAVYAPLYYGYGGPDQYAERTRVARSIEMAIMEKAPDTVLILVRARPEVIARRMRENPHPRSLVPEKEIELVLGRFEEEYGRTLLRRKFTLDTSTATVNETLAEFAAKVEPLLSEGDRLRILAHQALKRSV